MTAAKPSITPLYNAVRWAARISSVPVILVFLLMFIGEGFDPSKVKPIEWVMLAFGPFGLILGMILGWWKEGLGGLIAVLSYTGALIVGDYSGSGAGYLLVCASPGFLFLLAWILSGSAWKLPAWMVKELPGAEEKPPSSGKNEKET